MAETALVAVAVAVAAVPVLGVCHHGILVLEAKAVLVVQEVQEAQEAQEATVVVHPLVYITTEVLH